MTDYAKIFHIRCIGIGLYGALDGDAATGHKVCVLPHISGLVESLAAVEQHGVHPGAVFQSSQMQADLRDFVSATKCTVLTQQTATVPGPDGPLPGLRFSFKMPSGAPGEDKYPVSEHPGEEKLPK